MKRSVLTSTLFTLFASIALTTAPALAQGKGPAAKVYTAQCAKCHSEDGKGIASLQPPDFTDAKWQASRTNKQLYNGIANGIGVMPGFKGALKPAQIRPWSPMSVPSGKNRPSRFYSYKRLNGRPGEDPVPAVQSLAAPARLSLAHRSI